MEVCGGVAPEPATGPEEMIAVAADMNHMHLNNPEPDLPIEYPICSADVALGEAQCFDRAESGRTPPTRARVACMDGS